MKIIANLKVCAVYFFLNKWHNDFCSFFSTLTYYTELMLNFYTISFISFSCICFWFTTCCSFSLRPWCITDNIIMMLGKMLSSSQRGLLSPHLLNVKRRLLFPRMCLVGSELSFSCVLLADRPVPSQLPALLTQRESRQVLHFYISVLAVMSRSHSEQTMHFSFIDEQNNS